MITIVMYHFVREPDARFPRLPVLRPEAFRQQLGYILKHYTPVALGALVDALDHGAPLPARPIVLTFDDGYREHHATVFPMLASAGVPATFFPVRSSLLGRHVLEVNKIQFILAASRDTRELSSRIDALLPSGAAVHYHRTWEVATRFDPADVVYVKRMLQHAMPDDLRVPLINELFREHVTSNDAAFAEQLYMTAGDARALLTAGMEIGAHGDRHLPLTSLDRDAQAREIDGALQVLDAVGVRRDRFLYSYAKGDFDTVTIDILRSRGCRAAVSTRPGLASAEDNRLTLPRIDTNDLPCDADAAPNDWTMRAAS